MTEDRAPYAVDRANPLAPWPFPAPKPGGPFAPKSALAGIDPKTRVCVVVGIDDKDTALEILRLKCIAVPVTEETARELWGAEVPDIYAIAERRA